MKHLLFASVILFFCVQYEEEKIGTITINPALFKAELVSQTFKVKGFNSGVELSLLSDSTFIYDSHWSGCTGGGAVLIVAGNYTQRGSHVKLYPKEIQETRYGTLQNPWGFDHRIRYPYDSDSISIKTEFFLIQHDNRSFLLSPEYKHERINLSSKTNDFQDFEYYLRNGETKELFTEGRSWYDIYEVSLLDIDRTDF